MKKVILLLLVANWTFAQQFTKTIEQQLDYNGQSVTLDVSFADKIEVKTWDNNQVSVTAEIAMKEEAYLNLYELNIVNSNSTISIKENTEKYFDTLRKRWKERTGEKYYGGYNEYTFNYVLYVPENATFKVKSINGSLTSDNLVGQFTSELINGDIEIKAYSGQLNLSTINGAIDLAVAKNQFEAETINGNIYADDKIPFKAHDKYVGTHIESTGHNSGTIVKLNTINGNMYLRL